MIEFITCIEWNEKPWSSGRGMDKEHCCVFRVVWYYLKVDCVKWKVYIVNPTATKQKIKKKKHIVHKPTVEMNWNHF